MECLPPPRLRTRSKDVCSHCSHSSNAVLALTSAISKKIIKDIKLEKEEIKPSLICRWHNCLHRKYQGFTKKLLELMNEIYKVAGYKLNIQKKNCISMFKQ